MPATRQRTARRRLSLAAAGLLLLSGVALGGGVVADRIKAALAPVLLARAAAEAIASGRPVRPWAWADFAVVGRLETPVGDWPVLDRASGQALAFAPGRITGDHDPLIAGHRETHFRHLRRLRPGDILRLATSERPPATYRIEARQVVHAARTVLPGGGRRLMLVTCWVPRGRLRAGPWRLLVTAGRVSDGGHNLAMFAAR